MRKSALVILLAVFTVMVMPAPRAEAMEPVTIALLAPVALKVAQYMSPYIIEGLKNLGIGLFEMGVELVNFFKLPLGMLELLFLGPFGYFHDGLRHIIDGSIAPFKLCLHALLLPIRPFGAIL